MKCLIDFRLRHRIQRRRRLVEDHKRSVFVQCTRHRQLLRLSPGNLHTILDLMIQPRIFLLFHLLHPLQSSGFFQGSVQPLPVDFRTGSHIFTDWCGEQMVILKDNRKDIRIFLVIIQSDRDSVQKDLPLCRFIQSAEQRNQRTLSGTVLSHQCIVLSNRKFQIDMIQRSLLCSRIGKADVFQLEFTLSVVPFFHRQRAVVQTNTRIIS